MDLVVDLYLVNSTSGHGSSLSEKGLTAVHCSSQATELGTIGLLENQQSRIGAGAGSDRIEVRAGLLASTLWYGVRANHVAIRAGTGNDNVKLRDSYIRRDAAISMEGGDDYLLLLDNYVGRNADLRGGGGSDTLNEDRNGWGGPVPTYSGFEALLS